MRPRVRELCIVLAMSVVSRNIGLQTPVARFPDLGVGQRKLACSKNPDGCDRCRRENIVCHYSEQKPMGRPRKRQFAELPTLRPEQNHAGGEPESVSFFVDGFGYTYGTSTTQHFTAGQPPIFSALDDVFEDPVATALDSPSAWLLGDQTLLQGPPINFGNIDLGSADTTNIFSMNPVFQPPPTLSTPPSTEGEGPTPTSTSPCSCLSSIYLSLAALQQFPSDIVTALRTVRRAAAVAAQTIWCPRCGAVQVMITGPLIESFQNTMLLGMLLPIVAHGYHRLLDMVDKEANAAIAARQSKTFNLHDYGGLCGREVNSQDALPCVEKDLLYNIVDMPPVQWRTTVRALLRTDIYGHETTGFKYKGLKDLVSEMEYRQRVRHELIDAAEAAGTLDSRLLGHGFRHKPGACGDSDTQSCLQMIKMAKHAIDELLIA